MEKGSVVKEGLWDIFRQSSQVRDAFLAKNADILLEAIKTIAAAMGRGNKLLIFGNGGSAADSQHLAAEFVNRYLVERPPLRRWP